MKRNNTVDVVRLVSVAVVVFFHGFIFHAFYGADGLQVEQWAPPRWVFWLSWPLMSMPAFFVCGGFSNAVVVDKMRARSTGYAHYLANRGRRLTGGLAIFVAFFAIVFTVLGFVVGVDVAIRVSASLTFLLWFISVYLVLVALAPFLVTLHDRYGAWVIVAMAVGIVLVDRQILTIGPDPVGQFNMFLVWPLCHQFGIGYARGWFRAWPTWRTLATMAGAITCNFALIVWFGYPESAVGFANMPLANHIPPTLAMAALGLAQACGMGLIDASGLLDRLPERVVGAIAQLNALMMVVYLWHVPCLVIAGALLAGVAMLVPGLAPLLLARLLVLAAGVAVLSLALPLLGGLEFKLIPPLGVRQDAVMAIGAFALSAFGAMLVWRFGTVVHPTSIPATVGVFSVLAGQVAMARASRPRGVARDAADSLKPLGQFSERSQSAIRRAARGAQRTASRPR